MYTTTANEPPTGTNPESGPQESITYCSIESCNNPALSFIETPFCRDHMEMNTLVNVALVRGWKPSLRAILWLRAAADVRWQMQRIDIPRLLADIIIYRKRHGIQI